MPLVNLTRAIFLIAEFGFFGVLVVTLTQTPRLKGDGKNFGRFLRMLKVRLKATDLGFLFKRIRFLLTNWLIVDISNLLKPIQLIYYEIIKNANTAGFSFAPPVSVN
jgi:hypothetical protein